MGDKRNWRETWTETEIQTDESGKERKEQADRDKNGNTRRFAKIN